MPPGHPPVYIGASPGIRSKIRGGQISHECRLAVRSPFRIAVFFATQSPRASQREIPWGMMSSRLGPTYPINV